MGDVLVPVAGGVNKRFVDQGDGTVAEKVAASMAASESHIGAVGGMSVNVGGTVQRPADTTAYTIGDLIANNTAAGQVTPIALAAGRANGGTGMIRRLRLKVNDLAWLNAIVRVHLFRNSPVCANGDNGAFSTSESDYMGSADITLDRQFTDPFVKGFGVPSVGSEWNFDAAAGSQNVYALLEARTAVTPGSGKTFSLVAEVLQN